MTVYETTSSASPTGKHTPSTEASPAKPPASRCWPQRRPKHLAPRPPDPQPNKPPLAAPARAQGQQRSTTRHQSIIRVSSELSNQPTSRGWIAGTVVGSICGIGLGEFGMCVGYRKMSKARAVQAEAAVPPHVQTSCFRQPHPQEAYSRNMFLQMRVELDSSALHRKP
ncbi:uncharacterized protein ATNIH1004_004859 [Aspergillus tanneri]|uniref:Uncharacterized protein n=1 Tax=Aspergillus tanneri TaxID=1220188 RepID=A0A5M9MWJ3_9EURO|nr:uncharacterized protein ATNIH1004_004859 [Aspergillus tanneri]KAA8648969.1 hypothetical protein ATNIH1004_004859 [Aspergillus tanneri]